VVEALPKLSSGKTDRKTLKNLPLTQPADAEEEQEQPRDGTEATLLAAAKRVLPPGAIPFDADFFTDLGGHSLLAARFVSAVRETPRLAGVTLQDLYAQRTLRALATHLAGKAENAAPARDLSFEPPPLLRRILCGLAQLAFLPVILTMVTAQWLSVFVSYQFVSSTDASLFQEVFSLLGVYMLVYVSTQFIAIAGKWLAIGRTKPGRYPLWGVYYYRWWVAQRLIGVTHAKFFQGTPIAALFYSALGAKIGEDALISELDAGAIDLVSIGAGASLGSKLKLANARVEGNELVIGEIEIGADAYVGSSCVIEGDVVIGESAEIGDLSAILAGTRVGAREHWNGAPAKHDGMVDVDALDTFATATPGRRTLVTFLFTVLIIALPPISLMPVFPAFWVFDHLENWMGLSESQHLQYLAMIPLFAWPTAFVLIIFTVLFIVAFRWMILPQVREGKYSIWSQFYLRKWAVGLATEITLDSLAALYSTIYMRLWYQMMGAKIGKDSEIATNLGGRYDIVDIGEKCFVADEVNMGDEDIRRGWMHLEHVKLGDRVFIGNDSVVPPGAEIPEGALIGVQSKPPANSEMSPGDTWFGSPPIKLPVRQKFDDIGGAFTYDPPFSRRVTRALYEAMNVSLPMMLFITFGTWAVEVFGQTVIDGDWTSAAALFVTCSCLIPVAMTLVVVCVKWLTMGRYKPVVKPMWSFWALRTETCATLYWGLTGWVLLEHLRGTPFLPWALRLYGVKFGKGVYMDTLNLTEFDCLTIGDYSAVNMYGGLQTHLFEDRVMKVGRVVVGKGVTVGAGSTILYDTHIGDYARLGPLTLVMKGESIPAHTEWVGAPAQVKG